MQAKSYESALTRVAQPRRTPRHGRSAVWSQAWAYGDGRNEHWQLSIQTPRDVHNAGACRRGRRMPRGGLRTSGTTRSKSRRLTGPNAKSVKMIPGIILELQFSPDSKTPKTPKSRRQAASPVDNGHSGQHRSWRLGASDGCSERSECVWA